MFMFIINLIILIICGFCYTFLPTDLGLIFIFGDIGIFIYFMLKWRNDNEDNNYLLKCFMVQCLLFLCMGFICIYSLSLRNPQTTEKQKECDHEWKKLDRTDWSINDYIIYCSKCSLEKAVTEKQWNEIRITKIFKGRKLYKINTPEECDHHYCFDLIPEESKLSSLPDKERYFCPMCGLKMKDKKNTRNIYDKIDADYQKENPGFVKIKNPSECDCCWYLTDIYYNEVLWVGVGPTYDIHYKLYCPKCGTILYSNWYMGVEDFSKIQIVE